MLPTQVTTLLQPTILIHAYYKQNTPLFLSWLAIYSTSMLYHFSKIKYPQGIRTNTFLCTLDMFFCGILYISALYDYGFRSRIERPYSDICVLFHIFLPSFFIFSLKMNAFMWNPNSDISELWYSFFHVLIYFDNHIYLYHSVIRKN